MKSQKGNVIGVALAAICEEVEQNWFWLVRSSKTWPFFVTPHTFPETKMAKQKVNPLL